MNGHTRTRLAKLLGMTGSHHDGEAISAIRKAGKLIADNGLTWNDALSTAAPATHARELAHNGIQIELLSAELTQTRAQLDIARAALRTAREQGRQEGYLQGLREGQRAPRSRLASWRAIAGDMLGRTDELTEWEQQFIQSFVDRRFHTPTEKMRAVFEKIADKLGMVLPEP
jgi:flagellar biosynthesis/type III secretory pathway protein FliH